MIGVNRIHDFDVALGDLGCPTQIAPDLAKAAAKMAVRGKGCRFQKCGVVQTRQAGE